MAIEMKQGKTCSKLELERLASVVVTATTIHTHARLSYLLPHTSYTARSAAGKECAVIGRQRALPRWCIWRCQQRQAFVKLLQATGTADHPQAVLVVVSLALDHQVEPEAERCIRQSSGAAVCISCHWPGNRPCLTSSKVASPGCNCAIYGSTDMVLE